LLKSIFYEKQVFKVIIHHELMGVFYRKNEKLESKDEIKFEGEEKEKKLETLLMENPELFPVEKISEAADWIPLARQIGIQHHGTLDILATDDSGNLYIVECKIKGNQDMKTIRGQITDYVAGLWKERGEWDNFRTLIKKFSPGKKDLDEILHEKLKDDEIPDTKEAMKQNFEDGKYVLVYAVDRITPGLRDVIDWHNSEVDQAHKYPSFALELKKYRSKDEDEKSEFIVVQNFPYDLRELQRKLRKQTTENRNANTESDWNKKFMESEIKAEQRSQIEEFKQKLMKMVYDDGGRMDYGTGKNMPVVMPKFYSTSLRSPIKLKADGVITLQLGLMEEYAEEAEEFKKKISEIDELDKSIKASKSKGGDVPLEINTWLPYKDKILEILNEVFVRK